MAIEDPTDDLKSLMLGESWRTLVPITTKIWMFIKAVNNFQPGTTWYYKEQVARKALGKHLELTPNDTYSMIFALFLERPEQLIGTDPSITPEEVCHYIVSANLPPEFKVRLIKDMRSKPDYKSERVVKLVKILKYQAQTGAMPDHRVPDFYKVLGFYEKFPLPNKLEFDNVPEVYLEHYGVYSEVIRMFLPQFTPPSVTDTYIRLQHHRAKRLYAIEGEDNGYPPTERRERIRTRDIFNTRHLCESLAHKYIQRGLFPFERHLEAIIRLGHIDTFKSELIESCISTKQSYTELDDLIATYTRQHNCTELYA